MTDPRTQLVGVGYDEIADSFLEWSGRIEGDQRVRWRRELAQRLPDGARVLELGCGAGIRDTKLLAERFHVTPPETNRRLLVEAGFELLLDEIARMIEPEPDGEVQFQWVLARR